MTRTQSIHALFEAQTLATPDAVAILFGDRVLRYEELNARANRLAHRLMSLGVARGGLVGLCVDRSPEAVIGMLAVLKAGGVYVPLDSTYPDERLTFLLQDTAARVVLTHRPTAARLASLGGLDTIVCLDEYESLGVEPAHDPRCAAPDDDVACVLYTSGSTGRPKGVLVCHRGVVRLVRGANYCESGPDEVFLLHSPLTFDASTFEIWGALLNGGRLAVLPPGPPAPDVLADAIRRAGVTTLWLTAGLFNLMVEQRPEALDGVRQVLAGGDVLSPAHVRRALATRGTGVLINGYGPTECTTFACCFRMTRDYNPDWMIPIGWPISSTTVYVLDDERQPVAEGAVGELYLGGDGVALGYLNQPELTRERFVPDPSGGGSLYRTGDRVRVRPDGALEFLGRRDGQIKIAGHRIEPEEVEAALRQNPAVRQAAVVARALPSGEKQLAAYVVAADATDFSVGALKQDLESRLPRHLVPALIVRTDSLPLNANGKVDRTALATAPEPAAPVVARPASGQEAELAAIWAQVLGRPVGSDDNFFDLGGTSLQLLEIHAILTRTLGRSVPTTMLFEHPTIRSLARRLNENGEPGPALAAARDRARLQKEAMTRRRRPS